MERGITPSSLDLRSPQTKFNLMRKLQEVKEQNNSSDEEDKEHFVAGDIQDDVMRLAHEYGIPPRANLI